MAAPMIFLVYSIFFWVWYDFVKKLYVFVTRFHRKCSYTKRGRGYLAEDAHRDAGGTVAVGSSRVVELLVSGSGSPFVQWTEREVCNLR
jgi:hypothetical protein